MRFKLDECLDVRLTPLFFNAGHDIHTVHQQRLSGVPDEVIYSVCLQENQILITQDMGFSNPFRFSPLASRGIVVLKNPYRFQVKPLFGNFILTEAFTHFSSRH